MAEDVLGKVVRIDDREFNPDGAKFEVWTKGRHKYIKWYRKTGIISTENYIGGDKISASLTDDEVIKAWLSQRETYAKSNPDIKVYKVIQDPYSDEPAKRVYGDGKSPYYLNNGCKLFIEWSGYIPNPEFVLGTFSTAQAAQNNMKVGDPDRLLSNQPITSSKDEVYNLSPSSTWVVPTGEVNASLQPVANYRDYSSITSKKITIQLPDGFTENNGEGYLILTKNDELKYSTDSTAVEDTGKYSSIPDSNIVSNMISKFKTMVTKLHGISDYDLKLCEPDSKACKLIDYKSPLEAPNNTPEQSAINDTPPPGLSQSKIKLNIQGLFDSGDGTTPGNTSSVFEIKAKTDMPTFIIWTGEIPKTEEIDVFEDQPELDPEYTETGFTADEEAEIKFQLGEGMEVSEGGADDLESTDPANGGQNGGGGGDQKLDPKNAGGTGIRRFQKSITLNGKKLFNGEMPEEYLQKLDFCGIKLEKHAAVQMNAMNKEFKAKFGYDITFTGGYRTFNGQNEIFDWNYFDTGLNPYSGVIDPPSKQAGKGKGRKVNSFTKGKPFGVAAAKPGGSQHGWGLAVDTGNIGLKGNPPFDFLEEIGPKYNWINPAWAKVAGPGFEPWHREYIGGDAYK
jgi:LAS superfamily LD-carboxypeptidase LdcB